MITDNFFDTLGTTFGGCLKDFKDALNDAYLRTEDEKGLSISASIKLTPGTGGPDPDADITISFTKEKVVIKKKVWSSNGNQLQLDFSKEEQLWTDDDLRTFLHCEYMAFAELTGFKKWYEANLPGVVYRDGSYFRGDRKMKYKAVA